MKFGSETGMVLIVVLMLLAGLSLIALHCVNESFLLLKLSYHLQSQLKGWNQNDVQLTKKERQYIERFSFSATAVATATAIPAVLAETAATAASEEQAVFIPDQMVFGFEEGIYVLKVASESATAPVESSIVLRGSEGVKY